MARALSRPAGPRWWEWPTVLSLDAPLVGVAWLALLAEAFGVVLALHHPLLLALSIWLVYAADRWADGFISSAPSVRHRFYLDHRREVAVVWGALLGVTLLLALTQLEPAELRGGSLVLAATVLYLLVVHLGGPLRRLKELWVALIFTLGTCLFVALEAPVGSLLAVAGPFALLCFCNCSLISLWEERWEVWQDADSLVRLRWLRRVLPALTLLLTLGCVGGVVLEPTLSTVFVALAASACGLYLLARVAPHWPVRVLRVLADTALLTPALVWLSALL